MGLYARLRNKKFIDVIQYIKKKGLVVIINKSDHYKVKNLDNNRTYPINPIGRKAKLAVPKQLIAMLTTLELPSDFWDEL